MDIDIVIYTIILLLLIFSLGFGYFYRQIKDTHQKKWVGTALGLLIVLLTSRYHFWHPVLLFAINAGIILLLPKSKCHLVSFFFSFWYLFFFRRSTSNYGVTYVPVHANIIQMILTLKLVGLAFDVNSEYLFFKNNKAITQDYYKTKNLKFWDMFHYSFNYVGIINGPYYRYRTFKDFFNLPFSDEALCNKETIKLLTHSVYVIADYTWPFSYALSEEFYNERTWLYRFWYSWPIFFIFRMQIYNGSLLSQAVCTMVGLGAYPSLTEPKPGQGPTKYFEEIQKIINSPKRLTNEKYDFKTIHNMYPYHAEFCTTSRESMKNWNICIQYWLAVNVYKRFPNKKFRTIATMLVSAYWHGSYIGYFVSIGNVPFYLALEDVYVKLFIKNNGGMSLKIWEWILWFFKMQAFSYLSVAFHLLTLEEVIRYYKATYCCGFIVGAILYAIGLYMLSMRKVETKKRSSVVQVLEENAIINNYF